MCEKEKVAEEEVTGVGMRSRYNHGENYFQAPGRIISTPLRRLDGGRGWVTGGREGGWTGWFGAIEEAETDEVGEV